MYRPRKYYLDDENAGGNATLTNEDVFSGTYYTPIALPAGQANATAQVLYDSTDYTSERLAMDVSPQDAAPHRYVIGGEARPDMDRRGALIHAVDVGIYAYATSGWVTTARLYFGARIIVAPQDYDGRAIIDPGYGMWQPFGGGGAQMFEPSRFANGRQNCWEGRYFKHFKTIDDGAHDGWVFKQRVKFKRRLAANEGLFLYLELHPASIGLSGSANFVNLWCRTLVSDTNNR